jgi:N-acyl homoserine lactone hydrolase
MHVITGFCCINENFVEGVWPVTPPGIHANAAQAYDSMLKVKEVADIIIPLHESTFAERDDSIEGHGRREAQANPR